MSNNWSARPAVRENVGLFLGFAGEQGSGKTWTMLEIATGIAPDGNFCVIDTENKRALHYADDFKFDHIPFEPPYSSERYADAVNYALGRGYKAIVLDSASHEHEGIGGYLDAQAEDLETRVKRYMDKYPSSKEYEVIEKMTPSSWIAPKRERKRMMQLLLNASTSTPVLFGFRAEEKVFGSKDGKLVAFNPPKWQPNCGKGMPFEMTAFFLMHQDKPGVIAETLKLPGKLKPIFPMDGKPLTRACGERIAEWARGAKAPASASNSGQGSQPDTDSGDYLTADQVIALTDKMKENSIKTEKLIEKIGVSSVSLIPAGLYARAMAWVDAAIEAKRSAPR